MEFRLNPALDAAALAAWFVDKGRVTIPDLLDRDTAERLHANLRQREDWKQVINSGDKLVELDRTTQKGLSAEKRAALDEAVYAGARRGFQFRYETIRVPDQRAEREASEDPLAKFALWWSNGEPRDFLRKITGDVRITFADAQATAYAPGDFLTGHDDDVAGKGRVAAYVLGLNPRWDYEWGGLFLHHHPSGRTADCIVPGMNTLNLFRVPQPHSVTQVTRISPYRRYSITGWLRR